MKISNKNIIIILSLGLIFLIISTLNYAYRIPELDKQISDKKSDHDFILEKFYDAQFGYTNLKIDQSTISLLSVMMNISDIKLNYNGDLFIDYRKNGVNERHTANEAEEAQILIPILFKSMEDERQILRNYCLAQVNCSVEQFDQMYGDDLIEMREPLLKGVEENLKRTKDEITDLEKQKQKILVRSLIFQIMGISLSQMAIIMQIIKGNN